MSMVEEGDGGCVAFLLAKRPVVGSWECKEGWKISSLSTSSTVAQ